MGLGTLNCVLYALFPDFRYFINNFSELPFFVDLIGLFFMGYAWGISWGVVFVPQVALNDPEAHETVHSLLFFMPRSVRGKPLRVMAGFLLVLLSALHAYLFYDGFFGG